MKTPLIFSCSLLSLAQLSGCGGNPQEAVNLKPAFLGEISASQYDGVSDDLLTAGLGKSGLAGAAPALADSANPTPAELRRLAIYNNYRALVDMTADGGYGRLYGPNLDASGRDSGGEGKISGREYLAYSDDGSGKQNVLLLVQVPNSFNPAAPCIVAAPSSGSRGVYGAIGTAGEWGLQRGCAVAYTDKGAGLGLHELTPDTVVLQNGQRASAASAGKLAQFSANLSQAERSAYISSQSLPLSAFKHAHSQKNPEKDWGKWTLQSIEFALYVLNEQHGKLAADGKRRLASITAKNTLVIASGVSNGGGAVLAAAEQDSSELIDAVVAGEPNVQLAPDQRLSVVRGETRLQGSGKSLYDYITLANLLQPCAALAPQTADAPLLAAIARPNAIARCVALRNAGLLSGNNAEEMGQAAQTLLLQAGWQPESRWLHAMNYAIAAPALAATYANAYGKFNVNDNLCGYGFTMSLPNGQLLAGQGSGIPAGGLALINLKSPGGPLADAVSLSPSSGAADFNSDGARCLRDLLSASSAEARRVQAGVAEVQRSANLRGKPALIVHGRDDALLPVAFTSRPYFGINRLVEGNASKLSYIEVSNAQHFDTLLAQAPFASRYLPLHVYYRRALDQMWANLKNGAALPPSQLVRTTPRAKLANGALQPVTDDLLPPIAAKPAAADQILFANNQLTIPD
ncbi:3-hydroxybutyrate oligomer hydrolase family protein [Massilia sp. W12]|uniref:3-hydroxybutyrate oligomer hydrolase family protein n=1 Tax=Massilia sp. W12 TaxID=3126507 RepID=UPI0030CBA641